MQECKQNTPLCQCIDWKSGDIAVGVNHFINHFDFQGFTLEYSTLEPENRPVYGLRETAVHWPRPACGVWRGRFPVGGLQLDVSDVERAA